jgi:polysaccharide export outer membrane protein
MIAIAGGVSATGADLAILTGERAGKPYRKEVDVAALFLRGGQDDDVVVVGGDVIYVHRAPMFDMLKLDQDAALQAK